jgi:NodT family efflux transporter outer membrane factor (OMF) lipoprotein
MLAALFCGILIALGGCASSAGIATVAQPVAPASVGIVGGTQTRAAELVISEEWWRAFGDATLNDLIARALSGNPNLMVTQARLVRAEAVVSGVQSTDGPQVSGTLDVTRQRFSANSIFPPPLGGSMQTMSTGQVNASWELDLFGRNRAAIDAAIGTQRAAQADVQAARNLLASNVAHTYVQLGRLQAQRQVAQRALQQREEMLALIKQRVQGGLDTVVEQRMGEGALPETAVQIEQLDEQISLARHALAALTAQAPAALDSLDAPLADVRVIPLPSDLPADLMGRRADITAARWRVEAASSDTRSAKAQFYPNINLTAFVGLSSIGLDRFLQAGSKQYGAGPAISLPIFDSGRLRANLRVKTADLDAAIQGYNGAVIEAVRDVADQIGSLQSIDREQVQQARALDASESAYDLSAQRYKAGLSTYLVVLNAEASVLNQRRLATDLKARAIDTQIALIRALGGGYTIDAKPSTPKASS